MGKLDKLKAEIGPNVEESTAGPDPAARRDPARPGAPGRSPKMIGVDRFKEAAWIEPGRIAADPTQPRKEFTEDQMAEMAESLKQHGQLQPIRVRWDESLGLYILLVGERRWRAASKLGLERLAAVIHDGPLTSAEILEIQVVENAVRANLKPIELANAIRRLIDEFGHTQAQVGEKLKMSQAAVSQSLSLLKLDPETQVKVDEGKITKRAAEQIAKVEDPEARRDVAAKVEAGALSEEETVAEVRKARAPKKSPVKGRGPAGKRPEKLEKDRPYSDSGYKFRVENRKGIRPPDLHAALLRWASCVEAEFEPAATV